MNYFCKGGSVIMERLLKIGGGERAIVPTTENQPKITFLCDKIMLKKDDTFKKTPHFVRRNFAA